MKSQMLLAVAAAIGGPEEIARVFKESRIKPGRRVLLQHNAGDPITVKKLPGRNELCPCGSGKKFKKCHIDLTIAKMPKPDPITQGPAPE